MNHKAFWTFLVGDTLAVGVSAVIPERTMLGLLMLGFSLVMTLAPTANQIAGWWSKSWLGDDTAATEKT